MTAELLKNEVAGEFTTLGLLVDELASLQLDVAGREPTVRERTAAAAFLAQFYSGIENVLKRLSRFHGVELPTGEQWHAELFQRFGPPGHPPLPTLFDAALARQLGPYRRFRHVVHHGYGFQIDWDRMRQGLAQAAPLLAVFRERVAAHLNRL